MAENNQEGYQTLGWIINQSEQGLYLVVADETTQKEIAELYRQGMVGIYDYKRHPGAYSFRELQEWAVDLPEVKTILLVHFHLAIQSDEDVKRLNFSRDMLSSLGKNIIFLTTAYGDDQLAKGAYDFYSFLKIRTVFPNAMNVQETQENPILSVETLAESGHTWEPEEAKKKVEEANELLEQAKEKLAQTQYEESEELLLKAR